MLTGDHLLEIGTVPCSPAPETCSPEHLRTAEDHPLAREARRYGCSRVMLFEVAGISGFYPPV